MTLSTHVLDATTGRPAAGVQVRLDWPANAAPTPGGRRPARARRTPTGGSGCPVPGVPPTSSPACTGSRSAPARTSRLAAYASFYPEVTITFEITARDEHYHVPLLLSPYAYSTYRGS